MISTFLFLILYSSRFVSSFNFNISFKMIGNLRIEKSMISLKIFPLSTMVPSSLIIFLNNFTKEPIDFIDEPVSIDLIRNFIFLYFSAWMDSDSILLGLDIC